MKAAVVVLKAAVAVVVGSLTGQSNAYGFLVCPQVAYRSNQAGSVHVHRAIADDQDLPPIEKRRPAERNFISILSVQFVVYAHSPVLQLL